MENPRAANARDEEGISVGGISAPWGEEEEFETAGRISSQDWRERVHVQRLGRNIFPHLPNR